MIVRVIRGLTWLVATGLGSGLAPVAPATVASLLALGIYYFLPISGTSPVLYAMIVGGFALGVSATGYLVTDADPDPHRAVWDEFVGIWATCLWLPKELPWLAAAFVCFRVLDIAKPWPIRRLERLPGGLGIMADDLAAGLAGAALLNAARLLVFR
ncbi:MAG: phosphatidylglycerophosphatase A [Dehalococcoidia bacterium]|nr:phosphatidylglycerophosphatase A [Dehalococcoidia bacterium]MSQ16701.1 phosphatidylglycerophosphatase A [Dehalococcoidia bacterium]